MLIKTALNLSKNIRDLGIAGRIMWGKDLKGYSTLRIGGEAEIFIEPSSWEDIEKIIVFAHTNRIPFFVLGGGSKVLFCDELFRGIVIHINNPFFKKIELCEEFIKVD
ncbi:MAG: FAD-binding protein, partial [Candidatus Omnitrophica bacterium]|nr:FAD-binding protein [Candidatus Omnitrophota bacterium]